MQRWPMLALSYCKLFSGLEFLVPLVEASRISRFQLHNLRFLLSRRRLVRVFWESELGRADRITMSFLHHLMIKLDSRETSNWWNFSPLWRIQSPEHDWSYVLNFQFPVHVKTRIFGRPQEWHEGQLSNKSSSIDVDVTRQSSARFFRE